MRWLLLAVALALNSCRPVLITAPPTSKDSTGTVVIVIPNP